VLNKTLDDLEAKYNGLEEELHEKNKCISDLEIILVDHEQKLVDYESDKKELKLLANTVQEQEIDYQMLKKDYDALKIVIISVVNFLSIFMIILWSINYFWWILNDTRVGY